MPLDSEPTALSRTLTNTETLEGVEIHSLDAFCTPIEERFERITRLGRCALDIPVVAITVVTMKAQWFKSVCGWHVSERSLVDSLCQRTVEKRQPIVISDLSKNPRYSNHPLVVSSPRFRFYAGVPLMNVKGTVIGTLCAMDFKARPLSRSGYQVLTDLAVLARRELLTIALHNAQAALISKLSIARRQALLDPLTRTWNRRGGMMLLEENIKCAAEDRKSIAVCTIDVNDFKNVNDTFGHPTGDRALRLVATELLACVRDGDGVCRFGDDEFFIVLVGASREEIDFIVARVEARIQQSVIRIRSGKKTNISVCTGIAYAKYDRPVTAEELLADADKALCENKMQRERKVDDMVVQAG